jgi:hypothetical protein
MLSAVALESAPAHDVFTPGHWGKMSEPGNAGAARNREIDARIGAHDRGDLQAFSPENVFAEASRNTR